MEDMHISVKLPHMPATAQQRKVRMINGKPQFYDPPKVADDKEMLRSYLFEYRPEKPRSDAIRLRATFIYKTNDADSWHLPKASPPDLDNAMKMLQDVMTELGFWEDDRLIADLHVRKIYGPYNAIAICIGSFY